MIEFKAECGHTVRARNEDSGGVVRCSYCGKPANVPETGGDELDFLFNDIEQPEDKPARRGWRRRSAKAGVPTKRRRAGEFNPFAVVLRLCYAALLIIIVLFVGRKFVIPLFKEDGLAHRITALGPKEPAEPDPTPNKPEGKKRSPGLNPRVEPGVVYVRSTPPGALVYYIKASDAPRDSRIYREDGAKPCPDGLCKPKGEKGMYVIEVALPIRDHHLKRYPAYVEFRRKIDRASEGQRKRLVEEYLLPDGSDVFIDETQEQKYIVRQYRNVEMRHGISGGVRAVFLPRIPKPDGTGFSIERLLQENIIPDEVNYAFDVEDVKGELELYGVPRSDWAFVIEALKRIGVIPCVTPDRKTRLFTIDIHNGWFGEKVVRDANP